MLYIPPTSNLFIDLSVVTSTVTWSKAGNSVFRWKLCLWSNKQILTIGHFIHYGQTSFHNHSFAAEKHLKDFEEEWISIKFVFQTWAERRQNCACFLWFVLKPGSKLQSPLPLDFGWVASVSTGRGICLAVPLHSLPWSIYCRLYYIRLNSSPTAHTSMSHKLFWPYKYQVNFNSF